MTRLTRSNGNSKHILNRVKTKQHSRSIKAKAPSKKTKVRITVLVDKNDRQVRSWLKHPEKYKVSGSGILHIDARHPKKK